MLPGVDAWTITLDDTPSAPATADASRIYLPLAGVIGRMAGTFEGYTYSKSFLQKMQGVTWDEAKLDTWIKSSQKMVPGSYIFYSMKKGELRGRIIEYLKAQSP